MKLTDKIEITNEDNMLLMARYPDGYFDLAIVDPPYSELCNLHGGSSSDAKHGWGKKWMGDKHHDWNKKPTKEYFKELLRVSKNQIIWGGNYFISDLYDTSCLIIWDKGQRDFSLADAEIAWASFKKPVRIFSFSRAEANKLDRFHPTQKPPQLYKWLLDKYAKPNDKILDSHLGSGSIAIACADYGFDLTACELDKEYYDKAIQRIQNHLLQQKLF
jgi:site-specific DNA-methyltransferase (adenine-specific)